MEQYATAVYVVPLGSFIVTERPEYPGDMISRVTLQVASSWLLTLMILLLLTTHSKSVPLAIPSVFLKIMVRVLSLLL